MDLDLAPLVVSGGLRGLNSKAPFARAPVVLRKPGNLEYFVVRRFSVSTGGVDSYDVLSSEDWTHLLRTNEAFEAPIQRRAEANQAFWIFRPGSSEKELKAWLSDLKRTGALVSQNRIKSATVALVNEAVGATRRDEWCAVHFGRAWTLALDGKLKAAVTSAELAWLMQRYPADDTAVLYSLLLERAGHQQEARAILSVQSNSGSSSLASMEELMQAMGRRLDHEANSPRAKPRRLARGPRPQEPAIFKRAVTPTFSIDPSHSP